LKNFKTSFIEPSKSAKFNFFNFTTQPVKITLALSFFSLNALFKACLESLSAFCVTAQEFIII